MRLLVVMYLITLSVIIYSSIPSYIKFVILLFSSWRAYKDLSTGSPCNDILEIIVGLNQWITVSPKGKTDYFMQSNILIHNPLFQLIKLTGINKIKIIILFNDQLPTEQLQLLHLKQIKTPKP